MIDLHYWPTPNGWKISIMLEECQLPYRVVPVDIGQGEQFQPGFEAISANRRIPAIVDHAPLGGGAALALFESGAILNYLAEKTGRFLPSSPAQRHAALQWLWWQASGLGPMMGQNGHFLLYAQQKIPYAIDRYGREVRRLFDVLEQQLERTGAHIAGDYSIADMACFPWVMAHKAQQLTLDDWPHIGRWFATLRARPQLQAGLAVGKGLRRSGPLDDQARRNLFGSAGSVAAIKE